MKNVFAIVVLCLSAVSFIQSASAQVGGVPPSFSCSNIGNTIEIHNGVITILMNKRPTEQYETLTLNDVNVIEEMVKETPAERYKCTARTLDIRKITISKKDGSSMPDAYNRLAQDDVLNDYFICAMTSAWLPGLGGECE